MNSDYLKSNAQNLFLIVVGCAIGVAVGAYSSSNSTLLATVIGGAIASLGNFFSFIKDRYIWEREQEIKAKELEKTEVKEREEKIRSAFAKTMASISLILSMKEEKREDGGGVTTIAMNEAEKSCFEGLSEQLLYLLSYLQSPSPSDFRNLQTIMADIALNWRGTFHKSYAGDLRDAVMEIVQRDKSILLKQEGKLKVNKYNKILFLKTNDEFRLMTAVKGVELAQTYKFSMVFSKMSESQRGLLMTRYFKDGEPIPDEMELFLPTYDLNFNEVGYEAWEARVNPNDLDLSDYDTRQGAAKLAVLSAWEADYKAKVTEAERQHIAS